MLKNIYLWTLGGVLGSSLLPYYSLVVQGKNPLKNLRDILIDTYK